MKKKIILTCSTGLSTSMFAQRMQDAALKNNIDIDIKAFPIIKVREQLEDVDALLLAPQMKFSADKFKKLVGNKMLVEVICPTDYGVMNGEKVLLEIWEKIK